MPLFGGKKSYDRGRILDQARRAVLRGSYAKAVGLYERVCEHEPDNTDLLRRLAIARARAGQRGEAWRDCRFAVAALVRRGFVDQAIGICRDFASHVSDEPGVWHQLADLEIERKRRPDAIAVLVEGRQHFRSRRRRADALSLLRRAHELDRTHFEAGFALADLQMRSGARGPARRLLEGLAPHARTRRQRRRLRARLLRLRPTPAAAWRWLVAALGG